MEKGLTIAHIVPVTPPEKGGMGAVAADYGEAQKSLGNNVTYIDKHSKYAFLRIGHAAVIPSLIWRLRAFDLVHLHYPFYGAAVFTALAARLFKVPLVITYHMEATGGGIFGAIIKFHRFFLRKWILRSANTVLVSSMDYAKAQGINRFLTSRALVEQPFWVDTPDQLPTRKRSDKALSIVFIGGMDRPHYFKGVPVLLNALAQLQSRGVTNWFCELIGDGELRVEFEQLAKELGIDHNLTFHGRLNDPDKWQILVNGDVHVLPSTTRAEAFGLVTVEAMTAGIPSLVSDLPGVRSLVKDGVTGFVIPVNDAKYLSERLETLLLAPDLLDSMKESAKQYSEQFNKEKLMKDLMSIYEKDKVPTS